MHAVKARLPGATVILALISLSLPAADWPRFRGPGGSGVSRDTDLPVRWSDEEGILWKTPLPGPGSSSPIVCGGRIFLTCYSGYGVSRREPGDTEDLRRHLVAVDAESGKILWDRSIDSDNPVGRYDGIGVPQHGYASSTPVTDGERVYAFFGTAGVVAYDVEGKEVWRAPIAPEPKTHRFGTASSPILHEDLLIVPASVECEEIVAFDKRTGKERWRSPATGYGGWWGTPVVAEVDGRAELLVSVPDEVWALNPENGKLRWYAEASLERVICPSVVVAKGVAYAIGGRPGASAAVRLGGRGDVSGTQILWTRNTGSYVASPVVYRGHVYWVNDRGIARCLKADTGEEVFVERLGDAGSVYASLIAGDGKLYAVSRRRGTFVLAAQPEFRELAHNVISSDESDFNASPAVSNGRLFLRSDGFLYSIEKEKG